MERRERTVSVSGLIKRILLKWKQMLICGLVIAVLGAAYRFVRLLPKVGNGVQTDVSKTEGGESSADFNQEYSLIQENLVRKNRYLTESIKVRINPAKEGRAMATIRILTPEMEREEAETDAEPVVTSSGGASETGVTSAGASRAIQILNFYENRVKAGIDDWGTLTDEFETETVYLNELVSVDSYNEAAVTATILCIYEDAEGAERLLEKTLDVLRSNMADAAAVYGTHRLVVGDIQSGIVVDKTLNTWMKDRVQEINDLTTQRDNLLRNSGGAVTTAGSGSTSLSMIKALRSSAKYGAAGFIAGFMLYAVWTAVVLLLKNTVLSAKELNRQYCLTKLAAVPREGVTGISARINRIGTDDLSGPDQDSALKLAAERIRAEEAEGALSLIGDLPKEVLLKLSEKLAAEGVECRPVSDPNRNAEDFRTLENGGPVILAAEAGRSGYGEIDELLRTAADLHKEILGSIVFD